MHVLCNVHGSIAFLDNQGVWSSRQSPSGAALREHTSQPVQGRPARLGICRGLVRRDLETGCLKLAIVKFLGVQIFRVPNYSQICTIYMYKFIKVRHDILIECHGNYMEMEKVKLYAWDWHFKKFLTKRFGCPEGCFLRVWASTKAPRCPAG